MADSVRSSGLHAKHLLAEGGRSHQGYGQRIGLVQGVEIQPRGLFDQRQRHLVGLVGAEDEPRFGQPPDDLAIGEHVARGRQASAIRPPLVVQMLKQVEGGRKVKDIRREIEISNTTGPLGETGCLVTLAGDRKGHRTVLHRGQTVEAGGIAHSKAR
jgi:hypothetical protein